jgi:hypothetical protein
MRNYYEIWSKKINEKEKDIDRTVREVHSGVSLLLQEAYLDDMLYNPEVKEYDDLSIGAVDGGEGLNELSGIAAYLVRASGLIKDSESKFLRDLDLGVLPLNKRTKARVQFMRATMEYEMAAKIMEKHKPDYMLIDGSLMVGVEIDPIKTDEYHKYITTLRKMLRIAQESHIRVVGVSEDSTSRGLINYLAAKGLRKEVARGLSSLTDSSLIQLYSQGRKPFKPIATKPFLPVSNKGREWVRKNTGIDFSFPTFYLQATELGRALRVDFPSKGKNIGKQAREIASLLIYLSQVPKRYGYPFPLYLAHSDAELPEKLMERTTLLIQKRIFRKWNDEYLAVYGKRRRDSRPENYSE